MSQSLEICEGLEGWSSSCACSDTEEEDTVQLVSRCFIIIVKNAASIAAALN